VNDDLSPLYIIWDAREGKFESLLERLYRGAATPLEQAFAANLIENKVIPRQLRRDEPRRLINQHMAQLLVVKEAMRSSLAGRDRMRIIDEVAQSFGVSTDHVRDVEKEHGPTVAQLQELTTMNHKDLQTLNDLLDRWGAFHCATTWGLPYVAVTDEHGHTTVQKLGAGSRDVRRDRHREIIKQTAFSTKDLAETE
jgi:hypothetical protein